MEREFTETVHTAEESVTVVSKAGEQFCVTTGEVTLLGREGTKSKGGIHRRGGLNNVIQSSVILIVEGGNTSWEWMYG